MGADASIRGDTPPKRGPREQKRAAARARGAPPPKRVLMEQTLAAGLPQAVTLDGTSLPLVGRARVYACGITPYDVTHLGPAATFVWVDTLARVLHAAGAEVIVCRNVTDVDDVLLAAANRADAPYNRFAVIPQFYFDQDRSEA